MKKFFVIALVLHSLLFLNYNRYQTLGDPNISVRTNIPISYNVISAEQRLDGINQIKGGEEKQPEPEIKKEENVPKIEKKDEPEIKSKMSKDKKKEEVKKEEKKSENPKQAKKTKKETTEKINPDDIFIKNGNFTANSDGTYTAVSSKGISFEIISQIDPDYPRQAEVIRYNKTVVVEVRFLVDLNGNVEDIKILKSHEKFGFDKEVISAVKKWKFKPIVYNNRKIKVYFNKEFVFTPKS